MADATVIGGSFEGTYNFIPPFNNDTGRLLNNMILKKGNARLRAGLSLLVDGKGYALTYTRVGHTTGGEFANNEPTNTVQYYVYPSDYPRNDIINLAGLNSRPYTPDLSGNNTVGPQLY